MQVTDAMVAKALDAYNEALSELTERADDTPVSLDDIREVGLRAALTAALAEMWQDMDSAPKDGGFVLVNDTRYPSRTVSMARWNDCKHHIRASGYWEFVDERVHGVGLSRTNKPTHFMPLPVPPPMGK